MIRGPDTAHGCGADPANRADMTAPTGVRRPHEHVVEPGARLHGGEDVGVRSIPCPRIGPSGRVPPSID